MSESLTSLHHDFIAMWQPSESRIFESPQMFSQLMGFNGSDGVPIELAFPDVFGRRMLQILCEMSVQRGQGSLDWIPDRLLEWLCPSFIKEPSEPVRPRRDAAPEVSARYEQAIDRARRHLETMSYVVLYCADAVFRRASTFASSGQLSQEDVRSIHDDVTDQVERFKANENHLSPEHVPCLGLFHDLCTYFTTGKYPDAGGDRVETVVGLVSLDGHEGGGVVCDLSIERFLRPQNWGSSPTVYPLPDEAFRVVHADFQKSIDDALGYAIKSATRTNAVTEPSRFDFRYKLSLRSSGSIVQPLPYLQGESAGMALALCFSKLLNMS